MPRKILVTGGAGFIGSHLVDAYLEKGFDVVAIDNLSTGKPENINPGARFFELDIESADLIEIFEAEKFDLVNHHAAQASAQISIIDPELDARVNVLGTVNVLECCRKTGVNKIIFSSSVAVYGEQKFFPADEDHPKRPVNPYGVAKLAAEKYIRYYFDQYHQSYTIFRYANVYGPRQDPFGEGGVVAVFSQKMAAGEQPLINGDGRQTRDFVYVGDIVAANMIASENDKAGEFNISTSSEIAILDLFAMINKRSGDRFQPKFGPAKKGDQKRSVIDNRKAGEDINWSPNHSLDGGLDQTVDFFKEELRI